MKDLNERSIEIVMACRKLYRTMSYQEISLKEISCEISISRPSIYNYLFPRRRFSLKFSARSMRRGAAVSLKFFTGTRR